MTQPQSPSDLFAKLVDIMKALRTPVTGCPWDLAQTHESIRPYLIEECYEVIEAIDANDDAELVAELGDVLLQIVLHAQIGADRNAFTIADIIQYVSEKMIRRHPHVFADTKVGSISDVTKNWERIKSEERKGKSDAPQSVLDGVPKALPALVRAQRLGEKAAQVNFDWRTAGEVFEKVREEIAELTVELEKMESSPSPDQKTRVSEELGDLLFALAQLARFIGFSAEDSLRVCSDRFISRFNEMVKGLDRDPREMTLEELEAAWQQAKRTLAK
jgi:MazG family protein